MVLKIEQKKMIYTFVFFTLCKIGTETISYGFQATNLCKLTFDTILFLSYLLLEFPIRASKKHYLNEAL